MRKKSVLFLAGVVLTCLAQAQDSLKTKTLHEVVVTGTKFEIPSEKSGKVIFKIDSDRLRLGQNLAEILNEIPGVQMDGIFGTPGTNVGYFVRGGRSKHSLILLDGVPMNDPTGIDPFFDLRFLSTDQLDNVELLQGGLSTLYGSSAAASVINVKTKNPANGIHGSVGLQYGSWKSFGQNLNINGKEGKTSFQFLAANFKSTGFSAALDSANAGFDKDGFEKSNGLFKVGYELTSHLKIDLFGGIDWFDADFDNDAFSDGENKLLQKQHRFGIKTAWSYSKGYLQLIMQKTAVSRDSRSSFPSKYNGKNTFGEIINKHELNSFMTILSGISFQKLRYNEKGMISDDSTSFMIVDPYTSLFLALPSGLNIHAGVRLNNHSDYGSNLIYNFNPSMTFKLSDKIKIKPFASVATSYITPSLYQLHTPWGGNNKLDPEKSLNIEYGVSVLASDLVTVTVVNFLRKEEDVIGYTAAFRYENISKKRDVEGVALDARVRPTDIISLGVDFSWVTSNDWKSFYRIPGKKAGFSAQLHPWKSTTASIRYQYTGSRADFYYDASFARYDVRLKDYSIIDLTVSQKLLKDRLFLFGSVYNLMDENFVGVTGYTTRGRNFSIGATYSF